MVGRLLVGVVAVRQEADAAGLVKVAVDPVADCQPLVVTHVHRDGDAVLGPVLGEHQVVVQLLDSGHVVAIHAGCRALDREAEHVGRLALHHAIFDREAFSAHELRQRVFLVGAHRADVELAVAGVDTRSAVHELGNGARGLHGGDCGGRVDAQFRGPLGVDGHGVRTEVAQPLCGDVGDLGQHGVVHDAGHRHTQQALFLLVLLPDAAHVAELAQGGLEGTHDGGHLDLITQRVERVFFADDHLGQVAEACGAQDDLCAGVGTEIEVRVATARLRSLLLRCHTIEDATLPGLRLDEGLPLLQEDLHVGTFRVDGRVVGQRALGFVFPPLARLGHAHAVVRQVGQGDQGRAAHAADHDDVSDLADEVVAFDGVQLAASGVLEQGDGELEQVDQRLGARSATTKGLQLGARGANFGHVPLGDLAGVQEADHLAEGAGPADLAVLDRDDGGGGVEGLSHFGQVVDALALDAEADAGAAHQDVEDLVEGTDVVHGDGGTVVPGHLVLVEGGAGGHQSAHGGHGAEGLDGCLDAGGGIQVGEALGEEVHVAVDGLRPLFAALFGVEPAGVAGLVDERLEGGWEGDGQDGVSGDVHGGKVLEG